VRNEKNLTRFLSRWVAPGSVGTQPNVSAKRQEADIAALKTIKVDRVGLID
jgi:hypothetical protein